MAPGNLSQISLRMVLKSGMAASSSAEMGVPPSSAAKIASLAIVLYYSPDYGVAANGEHPAKCLNAGRASGGGASRRFLRSIRFGHNVAHALLRAASTRAKDDPFGNVSG